MEINLISDTVTRPSKAMLKVMFDAEVGDDVFKMDPTVNKLEDKMAKMFGMEAAIFCPSGTMTNQIAIKIHTKPGDLLLADKYSHVYNYEGGGIAFNSGVTCKLINGERGRFTVEQLSENIPPNNVHFPQPSLVVIENTTNKGGGACWDFNEILKIREFCDKNKIALHLDGARLFNALVKNNETPVQYGKVFDTISICLSKGLGAPVGSVLLGTKKHIDDAHRVRKIFGGAMRQSGYLASAGIFALDNNVSLLKQDHIRAQKIVGMLNQLPFVKSVETVDTNIIIFYINDDIDEEAFLEKMEENNILMRTMGEGKLRLVTHLDFTDEMLDALELILKNMKF